jgi:D-arabinose 1-dehydrogenase-like Zn-dependent alcohol dehydrogenase
MTKAEQFVLSEFEYRCHVANDCSTCKDGQEDRHCNERLQLHIRREGFYTTALAELQEKTVVELTPEADALRKAAQVLVDALSCNWEGITYKEYSVCEGPDQHPIRDLQSAIDRLSASKWVR